ncbi:odorant receptor 333 [Tribolium castaneum]|uniref:Odorant receptor n=1 Tax=Tribolium castaneum TaxID=7070 RepID=D6WJK7_TRICA|nr:odorant receptor 333 [Tribolium castaneum]
MEFEVKTFMTRDYLKVVKFLASDIFLAKPMKILLLLIFIVQASVQAMTGYFMATAFNAKFFNNYAPIFFGTFFPLLAISILLLKNKIFHNLKNELKIWSLDNAGEKIHSGITTEIKVVTYFVIVNSVFVLLANSTLAYPLSQDVNVFFGCYLIHKYILTYGRTFEFFYKATYLVIGHTNTGHVYQLLYYTQHINYQLQLYIEFIKFLDEGKTISKNEDDLFNNPTYQTLINQRLTFLIKRGQEIVKFHIKKTNEIRTLIPAFSVCTCTMGIGVVFFIISDNFIREYYFRMGMVSLVTVSTFAAGIWSGQSMETNLNEITTALNEVKWYNFNKSNRKLYLIFLTTSMRERKIKITENYSLNYQLGLTIVRGIYSVISVIINMK